MMFIQASTGMLLRRATLIASAIVAMPAGAQESAIPNFTSANFGWLVNSGFDFQPVGGKVAPVGGPDPYWGGGIGLPASDFNYQPPEAAADPRRQGPSRTGPWIVERLSNTENHNLMGQLQHTERRSASPPWTGSSTPSPPLGPR
jgi:hypothetical protein